LPIEFVRCLNGPELIPDPKGKKGEVLDCLRLFDVDGDGDVDLDDAAAYINEYPEKEAP
jgi:hypothetical protein